jgi:hypothetical protein
MTIVSRGGDPDDLQLRRLLVISPELESLMGLDTLDRPA